MIKEPTQSAPVKGVHCMQGRGVRQRPPLKSASRSLNDPSLGPLETSEGPRPSLPSGAIPRLPFPPGGLAPWSRVFQPLQRKAPNGWPLDRYAVLSVKKVFLDAPVELPEPGVSTLWSLYLYTARIIFFQDFLFKQVFSLTLFRAGHSFCSKMFTLPLVCLYRSLGMDLSGHR